MRLGLQKTLILVAVWGFRVRRCLFEAASLVLDIKHEQRWSRGNWHVQLVRLRVEKEPACLQD